MSPPPGDTFGTLEDGLARKQRQELFSGDPDVREAAQKVAISELDRAGARGNGRKWWAFEGFTHTDCYLETDALLLIIEGKRTEVVSPSTRWYAERSQVWRNVEAAKELANGRAFGVIVAVDGTRKPFWKTRVEHSSSPARICRPSARCMPCSIATAWCTADGAGDTGPRAQGCRSPPSRMCCGALITKANSCSPTGGTAIR